MSLGDPGDVLARRTERRRTAGRCGSAARVTGCLLALLGTAAVGGAAGQDIGPHELFEERCAICHGHSGAFARDRLAVVDGDLVRQAGGGTVASFLAGHVASPTSAEIAALMDMMRRQIGWRSLYEDRCLICHDRARDLARHALVIDDGALRGRYTGRDIADFLLQHGRSTPEEAARLTGMLRWQRAVVP